MDAQKKHTFVTLPDGKRVRVSLSFEDWWEQDNSSGYVHPNMLAPDPEQPRKHMNADALAELAQSVAAEGVRQSINVTPLAKAPWATVAPVDAGKPFLIVSGHRRNQSALTGHLEAVPILVRVYASKKDHHMDRSLLNYGHKDLTDLEQGFEAIGLRDNDGWSINELCERFAVKTPQLYARMNLTKLAPSIQVLLDPALPPKKRLGTTLGGALGNVKPPSKEELSELLELFSELLPDDAAILHGDIDSLDEKERCFALQRLLLHIIQKRNLASDRGIEFIREQTLQLEAAVHSSAGGAKTTRYEPRRRKEVLTGLLKAVRGSVVMDWKPEELRRIFEFSSYEDLQEFIGAFEEVNDFLAGLVSILKDVQRTKHPTHPAILELNAKKKAGT